VRTSLFDEIEVASLIMNRAVLIEIFH